VQSNRNSIKAWLAVIFSVEVILGCFGPAHASLDQEWRAITAKAFELYARDDFDGALREYAKAAQLVRSDPALSDVYADTVINLATVQLDLGKTDSADRLLRTLETGNLYKSPRDKLLEVRYLRRVEGVALRAGDFVRALSIRREIMRLLAERFSKNSPFYMDEMSQYAIDAIMADEITEAHDVISSLSELGRSGEPELERISEECFIKVRPVLQVRFRVLLGTSLARAKTMVELRELIGPNNAELLLDWITLHNQASARGDTALATSASEHFFSLWDKQSSADHDSQAIAFALGASVKHFEEHVPTKVDFASIKHAMALWNSRTDVTGMTKADAQLGYQLTNVFAASLAAQGRLSEAEKVLDKARIDRFVIVNDIQMAPAHLARHFYIAEGYERLHDVAGVKRQYSALRALAQSSLRGSDRFRAMTLINFRERERLRALATAKIR
jgi:hypothetical protein